MSRFLFRHNLNNIYCKFIFNDSSKNNSDSSLKVNSCLQLTKNLKALSRNDIIVNNSKILLQNHLKSPKLYTLRCATSKSITIKEYKSSRKYTRIWKLERLMGWSLIVMIPVAFAIESKELEIALSAAGLMHTYWGCQSMCSDYLRSSVVGKVLPIIVRVSIVLLTFVSFAGFYQLIYEDVGIINMIKKFWSIRGQDYVPPNRLQQLELKKKQKN